MKHIELPTQSVTPNPNQPRKLFDQGALQELADSIVQNGLLEPIVVRPSDTEGEYIIVAGERRWRAVNLAGLDTIHATIVDMGEADAYVLSVAENLNRADMTVMEECDSFHQLLAYGHTVADVAKMFGKSCTYVSTRLSFSDLCEEARELVSRGNIGPWLARYIAKLQTANQRTVVNKWARGEFDNETVASEFAAALHDAETQVGFFDMEEPTHEEREDHKRKSKEASTKLDKIQQAAQLLADVAAQSPEELADLLGRDAAVRLRELDRLADATQKARSNVRRAKLAFDAQTLTLSTQIA